MFAYHYYCYQVFTHHYILLPRVHLSVYYATKCSITIIFCYQVFNYHYIWLQSVHLPNHYFATKCFYQLIILLHSDNLPTGRHSAVANLSDYRCTSGCRSRALEFHPTWSQIFAEITHAIISTAILFPSTDSFKKGCCQLQAIVCASGTGLTACSSLLRKKGG